MSEKLPIALQLYTVRDALSQDWEGTLEQIAEMGYLGVETAGFGYAPSMELAIEKLNSLGLQPMAAHSGLPIGDDKNKIIEMMDALGCQKVICAGTGRDSFSSLTDIEARAEVFNQANDNAKAAGLQFGLHNHWWEFVNVDGRSAMDVLIACGLEDDIFFEIDTYWVQTAWLDPAAVVAKYSDRTPLLHIKDGPTGIASDMTAVGTGVMRFDQIIPAAKVAEWLVVELDRCATDMLTAVSQSITWLTENGLGRGR